MDARHGRQDRKSAHLASLAILLVALVPFLGGASYRSPNFVVDAPSREMAQRVASHAEICRVTIARAWLGHELADWTAPCPIKVRLTAGEAGGLTSFGFNQGRVSDQSITVDLFTRRGELPLARLFQVEDYPKDLMGFYGQGYSISRFLIEMGGRPRFLKFVRDGMSDGWDTATRSHYKLASVRELDRAWRSWHKIALEPGRLSATNDLVADGR
jgi:hypothetical protein